MAKKPVLLCIMDGFGWVPEHTFGNAIVTAKKPNLDKLFETYPYTTIQASGMAVGLPEGQMGNSEVGHTNMGAGRIVYQQLTLITKSIMDGTMKENDVLVRNMRAAIDAGKAIHLMGLLGTGGVHSHIEHLFGLLDLAKHLGAKKVYVHCIMDGRDTDPHSGKGFLADLQKKLDELGVGEIATVTGRYYAMDRDSNWDREEKAYAAFVYGEGNHAANAMEAIEKSYADGVTDEFVVPCVTCEGGRVQEGDTVVFINFRPDRARQITRIFVDDDFKGFERRYGRFHVQYVCMAEYDATMPNVEVAYPPVELTNGLEGMDLLQAAMQYHLGEFGVIFTAVILWLFSFSTFLGILFYARSHVAYLFGDKWVWQTLYKVLALVMLFVGGLQAYTVVWDLGDVGVGLMTVFNLMVLFPLSGEALRALREYEEKKKMK